MKFQVFKNGEICKEFELFGAHLFGADNIPMRSGVTISFSGGIIETKKKSPEAAGLALLWPVEGFGKIYLPTTRLPERAEPYNLNLEIARAKLMQITIKREDWALLEGSTEHSKKLEEARGALIEALQYIDEPAKASVLADVSLQKAVIFSENLTAAYADLLFNARRKTRGFVKHTLGMTINPCHISKPEYQDMLAETGTFATVPINWRQIEPEKGKYDFSSVDACVESLVKKRFIIAAGPLLRFQKQFLPDWLLNETGGFEKIRELGYGFVTKIVTRYSKYIQMWKVISGLNAFNHFGFNFEQTLEMTRTATLAAKAANVKSIKMIEIAQPWGEYYAFRPETIPPLVYVDMVNQSGINFDAFGVEILLGKNEAGMHMRDLMHISAMFDRFVPLTKPLYVSAVAVPQESGEGENDCMRAGLWRRKWDGELQAQWIDYFCRIALSKPFIDSVTYANFADDGPDSLNLSGLITKEMHPKAAYKQILNISKLISGK